jgi:hypothetical protein
MKNNRSRPGNRSRAKAYAANVLVTNEPTVTIMVILTLLNRKVRKGIRLNTDE